MVGEILYKICRGDQIDDVGVLFEELGEGVRNVLLMPLIIGVGQLEGE